MSSAIERGIRGASFEPPAANRGLTAADVLRANPFKGHQRIVTGVPSIDKNTRGGLPIGAVVTFQGKPGTTKTAFAIQVAMKAVREQNAFVIGLFPDEGRVRAAVRVGQNLGFDRDKLEDGDEEELTRLDLALEGLDFWMPDPDDEHATIEAVSRLLREAISAGRPCLLIVDSTQTARVQGINSDSPEAKRVTAVMNALRRIALSLPCLVLNISQVNRASYRNKKDDDNIDPLAAAAESRAVEFQSEAILHFDGDPEKIIRIRAPKNRLGDKFTCKLGFAKTSARLAEIDPEGEAEEQDTAFQKAVAAQKQAILKALRKYPNGLNATSLRELAHGKKSVHLIARDQLIEEGKIFMEEDSRYPLFRLTPDIS